MAFLVFAILPALPVHGQCQYEVTAIIQNENENCGFLPPSVIRPQGMNNHGEVVGFYTPCAVGNERAFYWSMETGFVTLPTPAGVPFTYAYDINDHGIIVGQHGISGQGNKGFVYDMKAQIESGQTQQYTYLEPLHTGVVATNISSANAINNSGVAAGMRVISKAGRSMVFNAVIWDTNTGEVTDLGVMNGPTSTARAINDAGDVTGTSGPSLQTEGWVLLDEVLSVLGFMPGGTTSHGTDINAHRAIATGGQLLNNRGGPTSQAAVWEAGEWTLLPFLPDATGANASSINDFGLVGGRMLYPSNPNLVQRAVLWQHGAVYDLADIVIDLEMTIVLDRVVALDNTPRILVSATKWPILVGVLLLPIDRPETDLNGDCVTDIHDLIILLQSWGPCKTEDCHADFIGLGAGPDGTVNGFDLLFLLANWG